MVKTKRHSTHEQDGPFMIVHMVQSPELKSYDLETWWCVTLALGTRFVAFGMHSFTCK